MRETSAVSGFRGHASVTFRLLVLLFSSFGIFGQHPLLHADSFAGGVEFERSHGMQHATSDGHRLPAMRESLSQVTDTDLAWALNDAGMLMVSEGRFAEAQLLFTRALHFLQTDVPPAHPARGTVLQHLGEVLWQRGDPRASKYSREAVVTFLEALGPEHPRLASALNTWALVLADSGSRKQALRAYDVAIRIYDSQASDHSLDVVVPLYNKAVLLMDLEHYGAAGPVLMRAFGLLQEQHAWDSEIAFAVVDALSRQFRAIGDEIRAALCDQLVVKLESRQERQAMQL